MKKDRTDVAAYGDFSELNLQVLDFGGYVEVVLLNEDNPLVVGRGPDRNTALKDAENTLRLALRGVQARLRRTGVADEEEA